MTVYRGNPDLPVLPRLGPAALCILLTAAMPLRAAPLSLPEGAEQTTRQSVANGSFALPVGPWTAGDLPVRAVGGAIENQSWRIPGLGRDTFGLMQFFAGQLLAGGYKPLFQCETEACGGFDFRYAAKIVPEPEMHVDLGDFRFIAAMRGEGAAAEYVALLISHAGDTGFAQLSHIGPAEGVDPVILPETPRAAAETAAAAIPAAGTVAEKLDVDGRVVLDDLAFATGATDLGPGAYPSLSALADYLRSHPDRQIVIVGHTDASGALAMNVEISRQRAQAVVDRLISEYGAAAPQLAAEGVGYLAPQASNLTDEGRQKNRRVEAVLASTR